MQSEEFEQFYDIARKFTEKVETNPLMANNLFQKYPEITSVILNAIKSVSFSKVSTAAEASVNLTWLEKSLDNYYIYGGLPGTSFQEKINRKIKELDDKYKDKIRDEKFERELSEQLSPQKGHKKVDQEIVARLVPSQASSDGSRNKRQIPDRDRIELGGMGYDIGDIIGEGPHAFVYIGRFNEHAFTVDDNYRKHSLAGGVFAVKVYELTDRAERVEVKLWETLQHQYIIGMLYTTITENRMYVFMEYADMGSIRSLITTHIREGREAINLFCESQAVMFVNQLTEALDFVHQRHIVHGDLHSGNALLFSGLLQNRYLIAKLSDFENSRRSNDRREDLQHFGGILFDITEYTEFVSMHDEFEDMIEVLNAKRIVSIDQLHRHFPVLFSKSVQIALQKQDDTNPRLNMD